MKSDSSFCVAGGSVWVTFVYHFKVSLIILMACAITEGDPSYTTLVTDASFSVLSVKKSPLLPFICLWHPDISCISTFIANFCILRQHLTSETM